MRKLLALSVICLFLALMFHAPVVKAQESETFFDAIFPAQEIPDTDLTISHNIANQSEVLTELNVWEQNMGSDITDGSYVGSIFQSSLFEVDFEPYTDNNTYDFSQRLEGAGIQGGSDNQELYYRTIEIPRKRSLVMLNMEVTFSNRMIMSGATELWVKIPINPNCINFDEMNARLFLFDMTGQTYNPANLYVVGTHSVVQTAYPDIQLWDEYTGETDPSTDYQTINPGHIIKDAGNEWSLRAFYNGQDSLIKQIVPESNTGEHLFTQMYATIEPNTPYLITFMAMLDNKPQIYLTEEDLFNNGRQSGVALADLTYSFTEGNKGYDLNPNNFNEFRNVTTTWSDVINFPSGSTPPFLLPIGIGSTTSVANETMTMPVDLAWSFVFKSGRGDYGMFGHKFEIQPGNSLVFYKELERPDQNAYVSVMIPFISKKPITVNLSAVLLPQYNEVYKNRFEPELILAGSTPAWYHPHFWYSDVNMTYTDYILFTVPKKLLLPTIQDPFVVKIIVTFVESAEVTFLFSTLADTSYHEYVLDYVPSSRDFSSNFSGANDKWLRKPIRNRLTYLFDDTDELMVTSSVFEREGIPIYLEQVTASDPVFRRFPVEDQKTTLHYELYSSVQTTTGIWQEFVTSSSGFQYSTHFFERRVAVGVIDLWVDTTNNETNRQRAWYDDTTEEWELAGQMWNEGNILGAVYHAVKGAVLGVWNGLKALVGTIIGVFGKVWDGLVGIGKFIQSVIVSFIDSISSIVGDLVDAFEQILDVAIYIVAIVIFMFVISWSGKLLYLSRLNV